ncbi:MAG: PAS domain S-box protein [Bacteroidia bacterium]|nr:PAS domain S-box protein [Bacteroidia bacterium]MCF8427922.1 PAS domain S-box protein [Bacteroidia bacterium]
MKTISTPKKSPPKGKIKGELGSNSKELEKTKEAVESAKQEPTSTNQELQTRNNLLNESYDYLEAVLATIHEPMLVLDKNLRVKSANKTFYEIFNVKEKDTEGVLLYNLGNKQWNIPRLRELLEDLLPKNTYFHGFEITHVFPLIGEKTMLLNAKRIIQKTNQEELILLAISDVTEQTNARRKIEDSEKRYNMMLMNSPFTFAVLKGNNLVIDLANDKIKEVWGRGNDIEGKSLLEIMPELKNTKFLKMLDEVRATGIPFHGIEVQSPKNMHGQIKEDYFFNFVFQPYLEADQTISGITIIGNEVTEQVIAKKKIEESEKKFKQLAELLPQKVWTADEEGNKTYFNQTLLDYVGMSYEELNGAKWKQMIHPDDWEEDEMKWKKSIKSGKIYQSESRFLNKAGKYLWHMNIAVPLKDELGKIVLWIGSKTEIEKQRKQKEILKEAVEGRTSELKQANEELIKMNKELEAFTYVSSHDLQEPLRKIRTIAGRLLEKENQNLSDSGKNYFHLMQNAAERMQTLIQDLLAFSHLSMADRNFETIDLNIIIEEVKIEFKDALLEKNAVIEVNEICNVKIIPFQFRQLMHNLISNSLKFSNPNLPAHIKISSEIVSNSKLNFVNLIPNKEYCHISISDNGIGFEKEFAEKIFEVFQKLHPKDEYAGTGIGLAIVKKIIENHNGIIFATSILNIGTTFDIYIPA